MMIAHKNKEKDYSDSDEGKKKKRINERIRRPKIYESIEKVLEWKNISKFFIDNHDHLNFSKK